MTVMRIMIAVGTAQLTIKVKRIVVRFQSLHGYNDIKHDINDANNGKLVEAFVYYDLHQDYLGDETPFCLYLILMETVWCMVCIVVDPVFRSLVSRSASFFKVILFIVPVLHDHKGKIIKRTSLVVTVRYGTR